MTTATIKWLSSLTVTKTDDRSTAHPTGAGLAKNETYSVSERGHPTHKSEQIDNSFALPVAPDQLSKPSKRTDTMEPGNSQAVRPQLLPRRSSAADVHETSRRNEIGPSAIVIPHASPPPRSGITKNPGRSNREPAIPRSRDDVNISSERQPYSGFQSAEAMTAETGNVIGKRPTDEDSVSTQSTYSEVPTALAQIQGNISRSFQATDPEMSSGVNSSTDTEEHAIFSQRYSGADDHAIALSTKSEVDAAMARKQGYESEEVDPENRASTSGPTRQSTRVELGANADSSIRYQKGATKSIFGLLRLKVNKYKPSESQKYSRVTIQELKPTLMEESDLKEDHIVIAVMGPTGAGKSTFISDATGGDIGIGHSLQSETSEIKMITLDTPERSVYPVVFVDTPGFDDTHKSDTEILKMLANWLEKTYSRNVKLAGILYLHRISDNRMAGTPLKNLRMFRELCGKHSLDNVILVTTMWDEVDEGVGSAREAELKANYWRPMLTEGSATARYMGNAHSAWAITRHFIDRENEKFAVQLQRELVDLKKNLPETNAGRRLYSELEKLLYLQQNAFKKLREESNKLADSDPLVLDALKEECAVLQKKIQQTIEGVQDLKIPLGKRILRSMNLFR